jgi:hypothetical protein
MIKTILYLFGFYKPEIKIGDYYVHKRDYYSDAWGEYFFTFKIVDIKIKLGMVKLNVIGGGNPNYFSEKNKYIKISNFRLVNNYIKIEIK